MQKGLDFSEIKNMSVFERMQIIQQIWDSIVDEQDILLITEEQKEELDRRLSSLESVPAEGKSWEEVKNKLIGKE